MKIQKLSYQNIDIEKYRTCLKQSIQRIVFADPEYLSSTNGTMWDCLVYEDYKAIMPVPFVKKMGVKIVTKPWGIQQLGVFSKIDSIHLNDFFYDYLIKNYNVFYYPFNSQNKFSSKGIYLKNNIIKKNSYENIRAAYSIDRRRNTRILPKIAHRISIYEDEVLEKYKYFYWNYLQGVPNSKKDDFWNIIQNIHNANLLKIKVLSIDDNPASIAIMINDTDVLHALLLLNSPQYFKDNTPSILIDQILKEYAIKQDFSFMGGNLPHIAEFFRRFSPKEEQFRVINCSKMELMIQITKRFLNY